MHKRININTQRAYSDKDIIEGLQSRDRHTENWFYMNMKRYFMDRFNDVFFDQEQKESIFQESIIRLWTQIEDGMIFCKDDRIWRRQKDGKAQPMTCTLNTFLFAIAKNEYREVVRANKVVYVEDYFDKANIIELPKEDDETEIKNRITDECIQQMSPRCIEILTLFYIKGKSLDEILELRKENTSKIGLKTSKYKCMNTLKERVLEQCKKLNINI